MPVLLAIETSQRAGSVAVRAENGTIHVEHLAQTGRHGDDLMPAIDRLLTRCDLEPNAVGTVAVSIGPGGFTGLRIAVSTVKMLAEALGAKVVAVPSALVAAENLDPAAIDPSLMRDRSILNALASKRDTFWGTRLRRIGGVWEIQDKPGVIQAGAMRCDGLAAVVADEHFPPAARRNCEAARVPIVEPRLDGSACLRAAERLAAAGKFIDPAALLPLYPRPPEAVTIWETRQKNSSSGL